MFHLNKSTFTVFHPKLGKKIWWFFSKFIYSCFVFLHLNSNTIIFSFLNDTEVFKVTFENDRLLKFTLLLYFYKSHAAPQLCREASATYAKLVVTMQIGTMPNFMVIAHIPRETELIRHKFHINLSTKLSRVERDQNIYDKAVY